MKTGNTATHTALTDHKVPGTCNATNDLEPMITEHLFQHAWEKEIPGKQRQLLRNGYVLLSDILPDTLVKAIRDEGRHIVENAARRIDITVKETSNSPRKLGSVNVRDIIEFGSLIPELYHSTALRKGLEQITGHDVLDCDWENERMTMTHQEKAGDTHGWHWGDYQYALIFIIDHPPIENGGMLQCVPHTTWDKNNPDIYRILCEHPINTYYHQQGDIYFFRTDTTLHRTYPLEKDGTRIILNFTFDGPDGVNKPRTHETQTAIYDF